MADFYDFNSTFFLSVGTLVITGTGVCLGYALKSKCSSVKCCGIEIVRDIEAELEEDRILGIPPIPSVEPSQENIPVTSRRSSRMQRPDDEVTSRRSSRMQRPEPDDEVKKAVQNTIKRMLESKEENKLVLNKLLHYTECQENRK